MQTLKSFSYQIRKGKSRENQVETRAEDAVRNCIRVKNRSNLHILEYDLWVTSKMEKIVKKNLQMAKRICYGSDLEPVKMKLIHSQLTKQPLLRSLTIDYPISSASLADKALLELSHVFGSLSSLRSFTLKFSECQEITERGLSNLLQGFRSLISLQYLFIDFSECSSFADGLNHLRQGFKCLSSLRNLNLNFKKRLEINDSGLRHISQAFSSLSSVQNLTLNFNGCWPITDKGLIYLSQGFKFLSSLQSFTLNFSMCQHITEEGLGYLSEEFRFLPSLQGFTLNLAGCKNVDDEGLSHLSQGFKSLSSLHTLTLDFVFTKISKEGKAAFRQNLKCLKSLKTTSFYT